MEKIYKSGDRLTAVLHKPGILLRKKNYVSELPACAKLQTVSGKLEINSCVFKVENYK